MTLPPLSLDFTKTSSAGPAVSEQSGTSGMFDASNWNVNFSGKQTSTSTSGQKANNGTPTDAISTAASSPALWVAVGIVALAYIYKKWA